MAITTATIRLSDRAATQISRGLQLLHNETIRNAERAGSNGQDTTAYGYELKQIVEAQMKIADFMQKNGWIG